MKLKEYIKHLNILVQDYPEALEYTVVYAGDDEGNDFQQVSFEPSVGFYDGDYKGDFYSLTNMDKDMKSNAVCVN